MSERVEYFVKCDRDMFAPTFTGMLAVWRAKRKARALDREYGCGPHRVWRRTFRHEHPHLHNPWVDEPTKRTITEEPVNDA